MKEKVLQLVPHLESASSIPDPTAIALIRRRIGDVQKWLVFQPRETVFELIQAVGLEQESLRESLSREIAWRLELERDKDYIISSVPRLHLEDPLGRHAAPGEPEPKVEVVEFYLVELYGSNGRDKVDQNPNVHWWGADQLITAEQSPCLPERQRELLRIADILREDHSDG